MNNSIKAPASKDLLKLRHLKILQNCTVHPKADAIWREFANIISRASDLNSRNLTKTKSIQQKGNWISTIWFDHQENFFLFRISV